MEKEEYKNIYSHESSHFFYVSLHQLILNCISKHCKNNFPLNILDAGCGTGLLAKKMSSKGIVTGVDINDEALRFSKKRGIKVEQASIANLPFPDNKFDLVTCIDVLYHQQVNDDIRALREFFRVLKPGGILLMRVPANNWLRLSHDRCVHTRYRYSKKDLKEKLNNANFKIKKLSYLNSLLFFPALYKFISEKVLKSYSKTSSIEKLPTVLNSIFLKILNFENRIMLLTGLPFGLGLFAVCQKPVISRNLAKSVTVK